VLSVKVQELVFRRKKTTYKDVANDLIVQLANDKEMMADFGCFGKQNDSDMSDVDDSEEEGLSQGQKKWIQQKWEKNVRRRVYDALNVLYAAGILEKNGKDVFCNQDSIFTKLLHQQTKEKSYEHMSKPPAKKGKDKRLLKQEIEVARQRLTLKRQ
jgi:hypothetical protein